MRSIWIVLVLVSILVLGTLGIQEVFADIIYESATLGPTGIDFPGSGVNSAQYLGSRFSIDQQVEVTEIGGHLRTQFGTLFGAIVTLSGPDALPSSFPLSAGEVVASTVISAPGPSSDVSVPLSVTLMPGDYAIIFGSNQFGANGFGLMPFNNVNTPEGVGSYFFSQVSTWRDGDINNVRFTVSGTIVEPPPDHYLAYKVKETKNTPKFELLTVDLADQFGSGFFNVIKPDMLYNPVEKTVLSADGTLVITPINNEDTHYVGYKIKPAVKGTVELTHEVLVSNQFGEITVNATKAKLLLVPSLKDELRPVDLDPTLPFTVDHFKCYKVKIDKTAPVQFEPRQVRLDDQFLDKDFLVKKPTLLCNPVIKIVTNADGTSNITPITNPDNHLMCYDVKEIDKEPKLDKKKKVWTNNQLGAEVLDVKKVKQLCLPSEKELL